MKQTIASKQKGRINRKKQELEDLLNRQVRAVIELNSSNTALQVVERHIRDLDGLPSPETIRLIGLPGKIKVT